MYLYFKLDTCCLLDTVSGRSAVSFDLQEIIFKPIGKHCLITDLSVSAHRWVLEKLTLRSLMCRRGLVIRYTFGFFIQTNETPLSEDPFITSCRDIVTNDEIKIKSLEIAKNTKALQ